jgi:carboxypeptidase C (cathepsin A)
MAIMLLILVVCLILESVIGRMLTGQNGGSKERKDVFCDNPISKGKVLFPDSIAGRAKINFDMYSGYVNVTEVDYLFYWFFSTQDKNPNAPLILWTNGIEVIFFKFKAN